MSLRALFNNWLLYFWGVQRRKPESEEATTINTNLMSLSCTRTSIDYKFLFFVFSFFWPTFNHNEDPSRVYYEMRKKCGKSLSCLWHAHAQYSTSLHKLNSGCGWGAGAGRGGRGGEVEKSLPSACQKQPLASFWCALGPQDNLINEPKDRTVAGAGQKLSLTFLGGGRELWWKIYLWRIYTHLNTHPNTHTGTNWNE